MGTWPTEFRGCFLDPQNCDTLIGGTILEGEEIVKKILIATTFPEVENAVVQQVAFILLPPGEPDLWQRKVKGRLLVLPVKNDRCTVMVRPDMEEKREFKKLGWKWTGDFIPEGGAATYAMCEPDGTLEDVKARLEQVLAEIGPGRERGARKGR